MLTKAIIQSIDYTKNICRVRIPLFEKAARNVQMVEADAQLNIVPGIYNSYKTGDIVFIGFEENKIDLPVILGKLFVSTSSEESSYRGNLSGNSLAITEMAQLPHTTIFNFDEATQNSTLYTNLNTPKKLADSIIDLQRAQNQTQKYQSVIKVSINNDIYRLYLKTTDDFTYSPDKSDEPLYRLCTALKNSQAENTVIPLDLVGKVIIEEVTEKIIDEDTNEEIEIKKEIEKETIYTISNGAFPVQEFGSGNLKLIIFLDGNTYEVIKNDILEIQSYAIYY